MPFQEGNVVSDGGLVVEAATPTKNRFFQRRNGRKSCEVAESGIPVDR